jgi:hypothetical protein
VRVAAAWESAADSAAVPANESVLCVGELLCRQANARRIGRSKHNELFTQLIAKSRRRWQT